MVDPWTESELDRLDLLLDQLVPANPAREIPGAGELGVAQFLANQAATNAGFEADIRGILECIAEDKEDLSVARVRQIERDNPEAFAALVSATYMGYYSRAEIRPHFGVGAHPVHPKGYIVHDEAPEWLEALTSPVRKRGKCYRAA